MGGGFHMTHQVQYASVGSSHPQTCYHRWTFHQFRYGWWNLLPDTWTGEWCGGKWIPCNRIPFRQCTEHGSFRRCGGPHQHAAKKILSLNYVRHFVDTFNEAWHNHWWTCNEIQYGGRSEILACQFDKRWNLWQVPRVGLSAMLVDHGPRQEKWRPATWPWTRDSRRGGRSRPAIFNKKSPKTRTTH